MTAIEKIKDIENGDGSPTCQQCSNRRRNEHFLLKAFKVMREIASENYYDNWKYGDESKERKEAFVIIDQAFEERMKA